MTIIVSLKSMVRSSRGRVRVAKALELTLKRAALPKRADATDATCVVESEHINAVERHGTFVGHAMDGPHHRCLVTGHEDLARDDFDGLVAGHLSIPEFADLAVPSAYRIADGILLGRVGRERSEPRLSVASGPRGCVCADHRLQHRPLGHFSYQQSLSGRGA